MITAVEVTRALYGAWRLATFDPRGLDLFDNTERAFWRSFYAALFVAPGYAILEIMRIAHVAPRGGPLRILVVEVIGYVIGWVIYPLVIYSIARSFSRLGGYCAYIGAYNWAQILQIALLLVATLIAASGMMPVEAMLIITFAALTAIMLYKWFIVRTGLRIDGFAAAAIVFLDLVLAIFLNGVTTWMITRGAA
jgi:hypothetical protein